MWENMAEPDSQQIIQGAAEKPDGFQNEITE